MEFKSYLDKELIVEDTLKIKDLLKFIKGCSGFIPKIKFSKFVSILGPQPLAEGFKIVQEFMDFLPIITGKYTRSLKGKREVSANIEACF